MRDRGIRLTPSGIGLGEKIIPLISGDCHYWRLERSRWELILDQFRDLGFNILQTYVPWSVHETSPGRFDFGKFSPNKDLPAFLDACAQAGLYVFLRPGPHINAEITYFGFPKRLFENPENLTVSATGGQVLLPAMPRAFPAISYASEHFFKELAVWYDAFAENIAPYCFPDGPVIGIQADNEMSYFFRTATYDHDYSHWARDLYLAWLKQTYGTLENLCNAYGRPLASFEDLPMPRSFAGRRMEDLPYYLDWCKFKEEMLHRPLERMQDMLLDRGFEGLLTYHNYPLCENRTPFHIARGEKSFDFVGVDFYHQRKNHAVMKRQFLALSGTSRFPVSPEFSSGCYQLWPPISLEDQQYATCLALAYGLKGFNFYMIVERERWYGSPITRTGTLRNKYADFYRGLNHFLQTSKLFSMNRVADALLLRVRDYDRLEKATDLFSPMPPLALDSHLGPAERCYEGKIGFERCIQIEHARMFDNWYELLSRAKIPFAVTDSEVDPNQLTKYKVIFAPTFEFMSRTTQELLRAFAERGGTLVIGPEIPSRDEWMREFSTLDSYAAMPVHKLDCRPDTMVFNAGAGRILMVHGHFDPAGEQGATLADQITKFVRLTPIFPASAPCETTVFSGPDGRTILFLINPTDASRRPQVETDGGLKFKDLLTSEEFWGGKTIQVEMAPYSVRPLEVQRC